MIAAESLSGMERNPQLLEADVLETLLHEQMTGLLVPDGEVVWVPPGTTMEVLC